MATTGLLHLATDFDDVVVFSASWQNWKVLTDKPMVNLSKRE